MVYSASLSHNTFWVLSPGSWEAALHTSISSLGSRPAAAAGQQHRLRLCSEGAEYLALKDHVEASPLGDGHREGMEACEHQRAEV